MHDDIIHDEIWCIGTNNYPVFTHSHAHIFTLGQDAHAFKKVLM